MRLNEENGGLSPARLGGIVAVAIVAVAALAIMLGSFYTVNQGERIVVTRNGAVVDEAGPGLHFKTPWIESIERFEVRTAKYKEPTFQAYSKDIQPVDVIMSVNLRADPSKVKDIYSQLGAGYVDRIVTPAVLQAGKETFGKYAANDIVNLRDKIAADIREDLMNKLSALGVIIETVQVEDIKFSPAFVQSIEQRMQAEVEVKKREQQLRTTEVEAQQAQAVAKGKADATRTGADAEAFRITATAKAQAEAIKIQGEALKSNPLFVELTKANRWDGKLPTITLGAATPMLDLRAAKVE